MLRPPVDNTRFIRSPLTLVAAMGDIDGVPEPLGLCPPAPCRRPADDRRFVPAAPGCTRSRRNVSEVVPVPVFSMEAFRFSSANEGFARGGGGGGAAVRLLRCLALALPCREGERARLAHSCSSPVSLVMCTHRQPSRRTGRRRPT